MGGYWTSEPAGEFTTIFLLSLPAFLLFAFVNNVFVIFSFLIGFRGILAYIFGFLSALLLIGPFILIGLILCVGWLFKYQDDNAYLQKGYGEIIMTRCYKLFIFFYILVPMYTLGLLIVAFTTGLTNYQIPDNFGDYFITYKFGIVFLFSILPLAHGMAWLDNKMDSRSKERKVPNKRSHNKKGNKAK
jgi:hypothetical protein